MGINKHFFFGLRLVTLSIIILIIFSCKRDNPPTVEEWESLIDRLNSIPGIDAQRIDATDDYLYTTFRVDVTQPVDHNNPEGSTFVQRIFLKHFNDNSPMVISMDGYSVSSNMVSEINSLFRSNHIAINQRYFNGAKPSPLDWQYLTIEQIAVDHHRIINLFKEIYTGKWISTGISKGGMNALCHRRFFPEDVDVTVAYVAPIMLGLPDVRINDFFETVGDGACRTKLINFQRWLLENKAGMVSELGKYAINEGVTFSLGTELVFEYVVLEYPFSFWQWGSGNCSVIPDEDDSYEYILNHLDNLISIKGLYSDEGIAYLEPFFYNVFTEHGYYEHVTKNVNDLLTEASDYSNAVFAPGGVTLTYHPEIMQDIVVWLQTEGDNIIYIYGANDPYSAAAVQLTGNTNAVKVVQPEANHGIRISGLDDKESIYVALENWLNIDILSN